MKKNNSPVEAGGEVLPEFADAKAVRRLVGISRSQAYELVGEGKIRSVSIRRRGALRGRRLFDCDSIRSFLNQQMRGGGK